MLIKKIKLKLNKLFFDRAISRIRLTKPIKVRHRSDLKILSQVHHAAVDMYLLAIKSFLYNLGSGSVYILNDGSLTDADIDLLSEHIPGVTFEHIDNINIGRCPKGGTWERLIYMIELSKSSYVIQLDSDTLTIGPLLDVAAAIENNTGFSIGNPRWPHPIKVDVLHDIVSKWEPNHVQVEAEQAFARLSFFTQGEKYIRGCSGFTGMPKCTITMQLLENFSSEVEIAIGTKRWSEWGSEQVASNVMIAQTFGAHVLDWPKYQNYGFPVAYKNNLASSVFIHFLGSNRFNDRIYESRARHAIESMM